MNEIKKMKLLKEAFILMDRIEANIRYIVESIKANSTKGND